MITDVFGFCLVILFKYRQQRQGVRTRANLFNSGFPGQSATNCPRNDTIDLEEEHVIIAALWVSSEATSTCACALPACC